MTEIQCEDLNTFLAEAKNHNVKTVIVAQQREYGQFPDPQAVRFERLNLITVLAYADGQILRTRVQDQDLKTVTAAVSAAGFTVETRSRNII